jgi:hypothetical protein
MNDSTDSHMTIVASERNFGIIDVTRRGRGDNITISKNA